MFTQANKLSLFNARVMILFRHIYMNVSKICLNKYKLVVCGGGSDHTYMTAKAYWGWPTIYKNQIND